MYRKLILPIAIVVILALLVPAAFAENHFIWPVDGDVVTYFSLDEHRGIDISADIGDSVVASQDGIVHWIGKTPRGEPCISIDHQNGFTTTYMPVQASVSKGQTVTVGDKIGVLSSEIDKSSDVSHLHFGVFDSSTRGDKDYVDPESFLAAKSSEATTDNRDVADSVASASNAEVVAEVAPTVRSIGDAQATVSEEPPQQATVQAAFVETPSQQATTLDTVREGTTVAGVEVVKSVAMGTDAAGAGVGGDKVRGNQIVYEKAIEPEAGQSLSGRKHQTSLATPTTSAFKTGGTLSPAAIMVREPNMIVESPAEQGISHVATGLDETVSGKLPRQGSGGPVMAKPLPVNHMPYKGIKGINAQKEDDLLQTGSRRYSFHLKQLASAILALAILFMVVLSCRFIVKGLRGRQLTSVVRMVH